MRSEVLYFIEPKPELFRAVEGIDESMRNIFIEEVVFKGNESDRSNWTKDDYVQRAKLSFLIDLHSEYSESIEYKELLGMDKLSISTFDRLWSIKRREISADVEEIDDVAADDISLTGNQNIDAWLKSKIK